MVSKAHFNPIKNLYELGEELKSKEKLSTILKKKKKKRKVEAIELPANESPDICGLNHASCSLSTEVLSITKCELLHHDNQGALKVMAMGRVHPNPGRIIHGCPMIDGFVKVQVDRVIEGCGSTRLLPESCTNEMEYLEDAKGSFIQWPFKFVKTLNNDSSQSVEPSHHSMTTPYRPQFEATSIHPDQTSLNETDKYQIYSYALQDDDAFTELLAANQPTELVHYCQSTKPVASSAPLTGKMDVVSSKPLMGNERTKIAKLLEKAKSRPQNIYELAQHVALQSEKALSIACITPLGMHEDYFEETIEFEEVIQLCVNGVVEVCFMHWFTMHLYETGRRAGLNNTAYFHPCYLEGDLVLGDGDFVIDHIKNVISFHKDKQWFMAPYLVRRHWVLILLQLHPISKTWKGYIFDSLKGAKDPSNYEITTLFDKATNQKIMWDMVNCRQQPNGWECGYCVMMAMYDFVVSDKEFMREYKTKMVRANEINKFVEHTLKAFTTLFADREDE